MNKYANLLESLKKRAVGQEAGKLLPDDLEVEHHQNGKEHDFRLPYSSDPDPIDEPWKS